MNGIDPVSHATPSAMISGPSGQPLGVAASAMVEWRSWLLTMSLVATLYLLCANPYWVPGGDSELYIAIARNLATGEGYLFNGQPVGMVPPGWPALMA